MAKKEKFKSGDFNLDGDLDFDNFDFGDPAKEGKKKDRSPVMKVTSSFSKGALSGVKSAATNSATIAKAIRAGMPKEYGDVMDRAGEATSQLSGLYNEANTKIKPELQKITKQIDKLVPEEMKRTKGVLGRIKKALGVDETSRAAISEEEQNESNIQSGLAEVFTIQAEDNIKARAQDRAERTLDKKIDAKRFESSFGLLNSINVNMARMSNYTTKVNNAFQKKSLELQYRSYYVQQDMLKTSKELLAMLDERTANIQKNTGLPDFVKRRMSEDFKEMTRRKLVSSAGGFLARGMKNVAEAGKQKMNEYAFLLQQASMGLDMAADAKDMMKTQKEMNESMGIEDTGKAGMAGDFAGDIAVKKLIKKLGSKVHGKYLKPGSKGSNFLFQVLSALNNGEQTLRKGQSKYLQQDFTDDSLKGKAANFAKGGLSSFIDLFLGGGQKGGDYDKQMGHGIGNLHDAADFNQLTQKSITTIIPGFLARIHGEIRALRTKTEPSELLQFDMRSNKFEMSGKVDKSINKHLKKKINDGGLAYNIDKLHDNIQGDTQLSEGASEVLRKRLHKYTFEKNGLDVEDLKHDDFTKGMSKRQAREIKTAISKRFNKSDVGYEKNRSELTKAGQDARSSIKNIDEEIQKLIDAGQEENLVRLKIIEPTESGYKVAKDAFRKLSESDFIEEGRFKTSDLFAKTNIKGFSGAKALNAIKNTKVYNWLYKKGKGDGGEHVGPMAQDVRRNFGDETAPDGKAIDVVSMNGATMAAVQELEKKVKHSNSKSPTSEKGALLSIDRNIKGILERIDNMAMINFGIPKLDASGLKEVLKKHAEGVSDRVKGLTDKAKEKFTAGKEYLSEKFDYQKKPEGVLGHAKNIAVSAGSILGAILDKAFKTSVSAGEKLQAGAKGMFDTAKDVFKNAKDPAKSAGKWFFEKGTAFAGKVFDSVTNVTTDILKNKLPAGWGAVLQGASWLTGKAKNIIDPPTDIYIKGREQPVMRAILMRGGAYFDQISKKPIKRPSDIKGPVIDQDGNVVLSVEDIEAGIFNSEGKPIQSIGSKLADIAKNVTGFASEKIGSVLGKFKGLAGSAGEKLKTIGQGLKGNGFGFGGNRKTETLLTQIRDVLNSRLPGKRTKFPSLDSVGSGNSLAQITAGGGTSISAAAGAAATTAMNLGESASEVASGLYNSGKEKVTAVADKIKESKLDSNIGSLFGKAKNLKNKAMTTVADKVAGLKGREETGDEKKPGLFSKMKGMLGKFLGGKKDNQQLNNTTGTITDPHQIHATDGEREGGVNQQFAMQAAREAKRKSETKVAAVDNSPRYKSEGNIFDKAADLAKGAFGTVISGLTNLAGLVFGGGKGGLLKTAGSLALSGAKLAGRAALGAGRFALGTVARVGIGASLSGLGTVLGGIGGTAMAAGGALLSLLASPVGLGIAATAAVGYGLYKGYKFLTRNKASEIVKVRMLQYGLSNSDSSHYHEIFNLESELLENGVIFQGMSAGLDGKKMNLKNVLEIFNLTEDEMNTERGQAWINWFSNRFKPVFLTHLTALRSVAPRMSLSEVDKLFKDDLSKFDRYFKIATNTPDVYNCTSTPLEDGTPLKATKEDVQNAVKSIRDEYKDKLDENGKEKPGILKTAFNFVTKSSVLDKAIKEGGLKGIGARIASLLPGGALIANVGESVLNLGAKLGVAVRKFFNQALTALESVRFKTYGLKKMKTPHISALRNLEDVVSASVSLSASGGATFNGDVGKIIKEVGSEFGLSSVRDDHSESWMKWFSQRFLPTFLSFMGSGFQLTGKKSASEIEPSLKEKDKYNIALRLSGTNGVWEKDDSPWKDEPDLCTNSSDCSDNLQFLKDKAGEEELNDPKAQAVKKAAKTASIKDQMLGNDPNKLKAALPANKSDNSSTGINDGSEGESNKLNQVNTDRGMTIVSSKIPLAEGPLADPAQGDQFLKLAKDAKIDNLNPEVLRNLKMMAAEYGQLTGKSLNINSGARTFAEQSDQYRKDPSKAAKPGTSLHEFGLAVDINSEDLNALDNLGLMRKYGFTRPVGGEPWHMEPAGIQKNLDLAKKDSDFATEAVKSSLGLGGGGFGTVASGIKGKRNSTLAASLLTDAISSSPKKEGEQVADAGKLPQSEKIAAMGDKITEALKPSSTSKPIIDKGVTNPLQSSSTKIAMNKPTTNTPPTIASAAANNDNLGTIKDFAETEPGLMGGTSDNGEQESGDIKSIITDAAKKTGNDPDTMLTFAAVESGLNPSAKASGTSATGLFQFIDSTWKALISKFGRKHNLDPSVSPTNPRANALMAGEYIKENARKISGAKSNPSATDLYLAHFLGGGGASSFLKADPGTEAASVMPDAARANRSIFFSGSKSRTVAEVYNFLNNKLHNTAQRFGIKLPTGGGMATNNIKTSPEIGRPQTTSGPLPEHSNEGNSTVQQGSNPQTPPRLTPRPGTTPPTRMSGPILTMPPSVPGTVPTIQTPPLRTSNMNIGINEKVVSNIDTTLTETLSVQKKMLDFIQQIASNTAEGKKQSVDSSTSATSSSSNDLSASIPKQVPKAPISLERRLQ